MEEAPMKMPVCYRPWPLPVALLLTATPLLLGLFAGAGPAASAAQPSVSCQWKTIGQLNMAVFYAASAMDINNNVMYVYGGMDDADYKTQSAVSSIAFGATFDASGTTVGRVQAPGALPRMALAGVY